MLVTYPDGLGHNLVELRQVLERFFDGAITGVHILPFYPSSSDRGFSPMEYDTVSPEFGDWSDLATLADRYDLMVDFMINHLSRRSVQFRDFVENKDASPYAGMFIRYDEFWPEGRPTSDDIERIYKRKPRLPSVTVNFSDGTSEEVWCTFGDDQIDLDLSHEVTWRFVEQSLVSLASRGPALVRLDAVAYAAKKVGGTCFFEEPETWEILARAREILAPHGVEVLPEMHEHFTLQLKLAEHDYWVYDFALPMLLLHALSTGETKELAHWLRICPRRQFTTLDTHDGIGVVDITSLLTDEQIDRVKKLVFSRDATVEEIHVPGSYQALDVYQLNCTYYSALGENDDAYFVARAIQMFAPGIPQVYYVGLLAGRNDLALVRQTRHGRDINRHAFTIEEIAKEVERPVVSRLLKLFRFRNEFPAFDGEFEVEAEGQQLTITRTSGGYFAILIADMQSYSCNIRYSGPNGQGRI